MAHQEAEAAKPAPEQLVTENKSFPFFDLPAELRNEIYDLTLEIILAEETERTFCKLWKDFIELEPRCLNTEKLARFRGKGIRIRALLQVCSQFRTEFLTIVRNTVTFQYFGTVHQLSDLGRALQDGRLSGTLYDGARIVTLGIFHMKSNRAGVSRKEAIMGVVSQLRDIKNLNLRSGLGQLTEEEEDDEVRAENEAIKASVEDLFPHVDIGRVIMH